MSPTSTLSDLANFVAQNERKLQNNKSPDKTAFWHAYRQVSEAAHKRPPASRVTDLLGMVMTLSSRTRRVVAPRVAVELDVFAPNGNRAVRLIIGDGE